MIPIIWQDPADGWFGAWKLNADEETKRATAAKANGNDYDFKSEIWTELKDHLAKLLHNKCAYCESKIRHVMPGDMEHYRPKSKVTDCPAHPGYYWLAYEPLNLLLSCELCNRAGGKMNRFPTQDDQWRMGPADAQVESPLLLNPYVDDPHQHLAFAPPLDNKPLGTIQGLTSRGEKTIEICRLYREELNEMRREAQRNTINLLNSAVFTRSLESVSKQLQSGEKEFAAACLAVAVDWIADIREQMAGLQ